MAMPTEVFAWKAGPPGRTAEAPGRAAGRAAGPGRAAEAPGRRGAGPLSWAVPVILSMCMLHTRRVLRRHEAA
jgi:hypothetical protein